jgi:hypothetical protein
MTTAKDPDEPFDGETGLGLMTDEENEIRDETRMIARHVREISADSVACWAGF